MSNVIGESDLSVNANGHTRREAIVALAGAAVVAAAACMGCNHSADGQAPVGGGPAPSAAGGNVLGSISQLKASKTPTSVTVTGQQAFVDFSGGTPTVISALCPHKGCAVAFNSSSNQFICPCHGSVFARNGSLVSGVARGPLPVIKSHVSGDTLYADS